MSYLLLIDAINSLIPDKKWVMTGNPVNETEFKAGFRLVTGEDENQSAILSDDTSLWGITWTQVKTKHDELVAAEPMRLLREERDRLIGLTDWWASSDLTMSSAQTKYRQDLRDITKSATSLDDVSWPEKP
jgi:hypothetical protein